MKNLMFIASACVLWATTASADTTAVYQTTYGPTSSYNEMDLAPGLPEFTSNPGGDEPVNGVDDYQPGDILSQFYASWTRIDDGVDQIWQDLDGGITVKAIYTSSSLYLGYSLNEGTGTPFVALAGSSGGNLDQVGETSSFDISPNSDLFIWGAAGAGSTKWSTPDLNSQDRMVTYQITGLLGGSTPSIPTYLIAFEDGSDMDFQDFVVEVTNVAPIPLPAAVLLGMLGLGAASLKLRKFV
jgi:hypothetical protein